MLSARQIHPQHLARADQITQRLLLGARDPDRVQLAGEQQPHQVLSVTAIVLDPVPARTRNLRRRRDNTLDPALGQLTRQRVPRRARLIRHPDRPRQTRAERRRTPVLPVHPKELQLTRLSIKDRRDNLRRVHVQTDEGSSLRHGWFLLCGCGPPRGYQPRGTNITPTNTMGEPAPSTAHSGRTDTPYGLGSTATLGVVASCLLPAGALPVPGTEGRVAGFVGKEKSPPVPPTAARLPLLRETSSDAVGSSVAGTAQDEYRGPLLPECRVMQQPAPAR